MKEVMPMVMKNERDGTEHRKKEKKNPLTCALDKSPKEEDFLGLATSVRGAKQPNQTPSQRNNNQSVASKFLFIIDSRRRCAPD
jgi:hypothetical protein